MTTQARPDWNAEMDRQIKATESAMALVKDWQHKADEQRVEIDKLKRMYDRLYAAAQDVVYEYNGSGSGMVSELAHAVECLELRLKEG